MADNSNLVDFYYCHNLFESFKLILMITMSDKDAHSAIINIPKSKVSSKDLSYIIKAKVVKKRICEKAIRKPSEASLKKYSLPGNKPIQVNAFKKDELLLAYKLYAKKQEGIKHKQRLAIKLNEKYKITNTDLRKRLHVEDAENDVRAVTDIDETFFQYINDHPLAEYIPLYNSLKFLFHKQLRMRQEVGYRNDCILNTEVDHRRELETYKRSVQKYMNQVKYLDAFISEDYKKSMACLKICDEVKTKVTAKILELEYYANQQFTIQSRLIGLDYMYFLQQKYGRFLYYLSPPSWRAKHREFARSVEIEAKGFDLGTSSEEDTFNVIFEKMQKECYSGLVKPVLYFERPRGLMTVFEGIQKQQLHHFTHVTHMAPYAKSLQGGIKKLKGVIEQDSALVVHMIKRFEKLFELSDERESQLQAKFMHILNGMFYETVASTNVLKLQQHLEYSFEKVFMEKPSNMSIISLARHLEWNYMIFSNKLDAIHSDKVKLAMSQCLEAEKKKMKKAYLASRELRFFNSLEKALLRAFKSFNANKSVSLPVDKRLSIRKAKRQCSKPVVKESSQRELTEAEIEYLALFTEWTESEDPAKYLKSLNINSEDNGTGIHI